MDNTNQVTTGVMYDMVQTLAKKLGRRVMLFRVVYYIPKAGRTSKAKTSIRYTLSIEGTLPEAWFGMSTNEIKQRMAMLLDLLACGVVIAATPEDVEEKGDPVIRVHIPDPQTFDDKY